MGIIVHDLYLINDKTNLLLADMYVNIGDVMISKNDNYKIDYLCKFYVNKNARDLSKEPLYSNFNTLQLLNIPQNVYDAIYADLKSKFQSYSDD